MSKVEKAIINPGISFLNNGDKELTAPKSSKQILPILSTRILPG